MLSLIIWIILAYLIILLCLLLNVYFALSCNNTLAKVEELLRTNESKKEQKLFLIKKEVVETNANWIIGNKTAHVLLPTILMNLENILEEE